jgi:hypothetical protein
MHSRAHLPSGPECRLQRRRRGQSLIEYILMTALLATLSVGFSRFYGRSVFGEGLRRLPAKVGPCLSHGGSAGDCR